MKWISWMMPQAPSTPEISFPPRAPISRNRASGDGLGRRSARMDPRAGIRAWRQAAFASCEKACDAKGPLGQRPFRGARPPQARSSAQPQEPNGAAATPRPTPRVRRLPHAEPGPARPWNRSPSLRHSLLLLIGPRFAPINSAAPEERRIVSHACLCPNKGG